MKIRKILFGLMFVLFWVQNGLHAEPAKEFYLENGMKVVVKEDHRAPVAVHMVWYRAGSMDETNGTTGVAHVLEHMMFKGTPKYPEGSLSKTVAKLGGKDNAFTNTDYTAYFQQIPRDSLEKVMEMEADRMSNLQFKEKDFQKEIRVVMEERRWRTDDQPEGRVDEALRAAAFVAHPYHWPVIGWMNDLQNMTVDDARNWYEKWYAPNNATMVVVGDVDARNVRKMAEKYFGKIRPKKIASAKPQVEPVQRGVKRVAVSAPAENPLVVLAYKVPALRDVEKDEDVYALDVLATVLDGYDNARLSASLVRQEQMAVSVGADYSALSRGPALFVLEGTPTRGISVEELEKRLKREISEIAKNGISPQELERVKMQLISSQIYKRDSMFGQAMEIGVFEMNGIGQKQIDRIIEKLKAVTPEQVQQVARKYFSDDSLTVATLVPVALPDKAVE
ncbi:M16 family metallopeptidase [Oxalobacter paraformigenes]|uniref:Peptidase M16 n=1 Tax=Oxalobacter paraformigenes TaxID=556268 RepID=C3X6N8_9BURK|nr:pitrilysin family protein [Oxalobacter paraformigenes]EEO28874.1 hypothetical protein OFAG_02027 [Oxalobacter paraformigenes]